MPDRNSEQTQVQRESGCATAGDAQRDTACDVHPTRAAGDLGKQEQDDLGAFAQHCKGNDEQQRHQRAVADGDLRAQRL